MQLVALNSRLCRALFEGKRWARRQRLEAVVVLMVFAVVIGILVHRFSAQ